MERVYCVESEYDRLGDGKMTVIRKEIMVMQFMEKVWCGDSDDYRKSGGVVYGIDIV